MSVSIEAVRARGVSLRAAGLVVASALLVMSVLAPYAFFGVFPKLVVADAALSVRNIAAHQGLFTLGILCDLVTFIADVVVAWGLWVLLRPANAALSMLVAWFRVVYATLAVVSIARYVTVLRIVRTPDYANAFGLPQLHAQVDLLLSMFRYEWGIAMVFFAVHLVLLGALVWRSGYLPRVLGALLVVNGLGYAVDSLRPYLFPGVRLPWLPVLFFGETVFMLWLFARAGRLDARAAAAAA